VQEQLGNHAGARKNFELLASRDPFDWYGLLARRALKRAPLRGARVPQKALEALAPVDDDAQRARLLYALGFDVEARAVVKKRGTTLEDAALASVVGDATFGWRRGTLFFPKPQVAKGSVVASPGWRVSYAAPWRAKVDAAAKRAHIPSSFVYAIMRTESGFDPRARSAAGAVGLMQLLPQAGRAAAVVVDEDPAIAQRLTTPSVAIDLGAAMLGKHKSELGALLLAAAAYNGGVDTVLDWQKRFGALPVELFVERVPYMETRNYVKRVLSVEAMYRALDGGPLALDLPTAQVLARVAPTVTRFDVADDR
jgi:soluble lytic murein transglycosylase